MNTTPIKILENITTQFSKFNTNQVLTETQLNEFLDYFKDQDHLTRIGLSGVGNACGFNIKLEGGTVKITHGFGVTTDGDLITLPKRTIEIEEEGAKITNNPNVFKAFKTYTHYRKFSDDKALYNKFIRNGGQIELKELLTEDEANQLETTPGFITEISNLKNKVVLLYLENYEKEPESCDKMGCDNQGLEQVARLKVLLLSEDDASYLTENDAVFSEHNLYELHGKLPEINTKRVILTNKNTNKLKFIKQLFSNAITSNNDLNKLISGYETIFNKFEKPQISTAIFNLLSIQSPGIDFQYRYDLFKDLMVTYNEIKDLLLHINVECCPNIGAFPKHLLLGKLVESEKFKTYRHQFYKSPIIGHEDANYKKMLLLIERATQLIHNYQINNGEIKITPSNELTPLSSKAIPFYYDVNDNVLNAWSYKKTSNYSQNTNLSYHKENLKNVESIQNPLAYNIDQNDFYRIEGHQGKMYRDALDKVLNLKEEFGLNFDVKVLPINPTNQSINIDDYQCEFEELAMLLDAWRTEQNCILSDMSRFFSGFKTDTAGSNLVAENNGYQIATFSNTVTGGNTGTTSTTGTIGTNVTNATIENAVIIETTGFETIEEVKFTETEKNILKGSIGNTRTSKSKFANNLNFNANTRGFNNSNKFTRNNKFTAANSELAFNIENNINVVEQGLTIDENTIGKHLNDAILENKKGSANDIYVSFRDRTEEIRGNEIWTAEEDLAEFIFNDVAIAVIQSYVLDDRIPNLILDIDQLTIRNYKLTIEDLCNRVKVLQSRYKNRNLKNGTKEILALTINQLATVCCSGKKLEILLAEIERRKQKILTQLQFSEFVKKHPGLEHKAGVAPGGTFIMTYLLDNAVDQSTYETVRMELDFLEQPNIDDNGTDGDEGRIKLWSDRISTNFAFLHTVTNQTQNPAGEIVIIGETIEQTVLNLVAFLNRIWKRAGALKYCKASSEGRKLIIEITNRLVRENENHILFFNPEIVGTNSKIYFSPNEIIEGNITNKNTIVADFSLPYMCCSDCAPVNFIIPKEPVFLSLPNAFLCLTEELEPIPFTVSPVAGEVKAVVDSGVNGGVVIIDDKVYFDAQQLDQSLYGQEILFTVNDEETSAKITVYKKPEILIQTSVGYNEGNTQATVRYTVIGEIIELSYLWDLGDGTTANDVPNSDGIFTHVYDLPVNNSNTITPSLTLSNGSCSNEYVIEIIEFEDPINANLVINGSICVDTQSNEILSIPFTNINPPNGDIQLVQQGISGIRVFDNALKIKQNTFIEFESEFTFTIDGIPTTASTIIHERTIVTLQGTAGNYSLVGNVLIQQYRFKALIPDGIDVNELVFAWLIDNVPVGTEQGITHDFKLNPEGNIFEIKLRVTNAKGCISEVVLTDFTIAYPEIQIQITDGNITDFCITDNTSYDIIVTPNIAGMIISGLGVTLNNSGVNVFNPKTTGLVVDPNTFSVENVLSFLNNDLLTINLNDASVSFNVDDTSEVNKITLQSTSLGQINSAIWIVNGIEINDSQDGNVGVHEIILDTNSPTSWTFRLKIQSQFCGELISAEQTSNLGFIPETVNLVIGESKICVGSDGQPINVAFTTIEPNGPITINEPVPSGLSIVNNQLVIDVVNFTTFDQIIGFSLNGVQSTATITISQPKAIEIGNDSGTTYFWEGDVLKKNIIIDAIFPASIDENTSTFKWSINNVLVESNTKTLNENEVVFGNSNTYSIDLSIVDQNGCTSDAVKKPVTVNYPNFEISLGNGIDEFCANDNALYPINVTPIIVGTVVKVSNQAVTEFIPLNAGIPLGGSVEFSIAGNVELTVNLHQAPTAAFSTNFNPATNRITLTNTSTGEISNSRWFINDVESTEGINGNDYIININDGSPTTWNFILLVESLFCGTSDAKILNYRPINIVNNNGNNQLNCIDVTVIEIQEIRNSFVKGEIKDGDNNTVAKPTVTIYDTVIPMFSEYFEGNFNQNLIELFSNNSIGGNSVYLFDVTKDAIIAKKGNITARNILIKYYSAQIALFFDILKCQDLAILNENKTIINTIILEIENSMIVLKENGIVFQKTSKLSVFLIGFEQETTIVFIKNAIKTKLIFLLV